MSAHASRDPEAFEATSKPWSFLDQYRGRLFHGQWPTIPELLRITTERHPESRAFTAFEPEHLSLTYREAAGKIGRLATYLRRIGVDRGDRVGLTGKNSPEWACAYLAVLWAGGVVVPLDYQMETEKASSLLTFVSAKALFVDEEKLDGFDKEQLGLAAKISLSPARRPYVLEITESEAPAGSMAAQEEDDLAAILFTSGTTGREKGVMLSHRNLVSDTFLAQDHINIRSDDVFYALLPIYHSYTMTSVFLEAVSVGAEIVFGKRIAVQQILRELREGGVTMFLGVPALFNRLLRGIMRRIRERGLPAYLLVRMLMVVSGLVKKLTGANPGKRIFRSLLEKASLSGIRCCISGGGPLPPATFRRFNQLGIDFVQGYGLTETSPMLTLNPMDRYKEASVGKIIPGVEMRILDPDESGVGEVCVRGPMVMKGYYKKETDTRLSFTDDGFLRTGDMGRLDHESYLYLKGRKKSLIVTESGKNIFPEEIEDQFQLYEEVDQILVSGYTPESGQGGERVEAYIYPSEEYFGSDDEERRAARDPQERPEVRETIRRIVDEVNRKLLPYERIQRFTILESKMETTSTNKIRRFKVGTRGGDAKAKGA